MELVCEDGTKLPSGTLESILMMEVWVARLLFYYNKVFLKSSNPGISSWGYDWEANISQFIPSKNLCSFSFWMFLKPSRFFGSMLQSYRISFSASGSIPSRMSISLFRILLKTSWLFLPTNIFCPVVISNMMHPSAQRSENKPLSLFSSISGAQ